MQVNPYAFTVSQAALLSQMAELQDLGHAMYYCDKLSTATNRNHMRRLQ